MNESRRFLAPFGFAALAITLVLSGCEPKSQNEIVIGEFAPLTGATASYGQSTDAGLKLAIEEINKKGGVLGKKIRIVVEDNQSKPEESALAVSKLISRDKVCAVIGEVASSRTLAAAPIAQAAKIPLITPGSTNPAVTQKGDYIFRVCFLDSFQGRAIAKFATETLKLKKVAILKDVKNDYSIGLSDFFAAAFTEMGGEVTVVQAYSEGDRDFKAQLTAIKAKSPQAIIVPGYYTEVALIVKSARELGITVPFLGGDGWDSAKLLEIGGSALNGCYFSNHYSPDADIPEVKAFVSAYKAKYGKTPDALAALGYDAGLILVDAIKRAGSADPKKIRDALAATKNFRAVTGVISMDANRDASKSAVILAIQDGKMIYRETITP